MVNSNGMCETGYTVNILSEQKPWQPASSVLKSSTPFSSLHHSILRHSVLCVPHSILRHSVLGVPHSILRHSVVCVPHSILRHSVVCVPLSIRRHSVLCVPLASYRTGPAGSWREPQSEGYGPNRLNNAPGQDVPPFPQQSTLEWQPSAWRIGAAANGCSPEQKASWEYTSQGGTNQNRYRGFRMHSEGGK